MSSLDFVYWLQGFFELSGDQTLDERQVALVKQHIELVLTPRSGGQGVRIDLAHGPVQGTTGVC